MNSNILKSTKVISNKNYFTKMFRTLRKTHKLFTNFTLNDLKQTHLGSVESNWVFNLKEKLKHDKHLLENLQSSTHISDQISVLKSISCEKDGHTGFSDLYTKIVTLNILNNSMFQWKKHQVHLNYGIMFNRFYLCGYGALGNNLLSHKFTSTQEYSKLKQFNSKLSNFDKLDNSSQENELSKLLKCVTKV